MPISKVNGTDWANIAKINGADQANCAKMCDFEGAAGGAVTPCWVASGNSGRIMYSTSSTAATGSWTSYLAPDSGADSNGIAYGKDNNGNDRWIVIWDRGSNLGSVSSVAVPSASTDWQTLDLDTGDWDTGKAPNDVAYSSFPSVAGTGKSGIWAIVGRAGRVAYSSTGSAAEADWEIDTATDAGFAGNRHIQAVAFSGSHIFVAGSRTRIVSASIPSDWAHGTNLNWDTTEKALDENDSNGNSQFGWSRIAAGGTGANTRIFTVANSNRDTNFPMFATGSNAVEGDPCCGDYSSGRGWQDIHGAPAGTFGDNTNATKRKMNDVHTDGNGNWMIAGTDGVAYRSTDNGATWSAMTLPNNDNGQAAGDCTFNCIYFADIDGTATWAIGGEDGYLATSTDIGANWTFRGNPWSEAGTGVNYHIFGLALNYVKRHPGVT